MKEIKILNVDDFYHMTCIMFPSVNPLIHLKFLNTKS